MKKYVSTDYDGYHYITPGKRYEVVNLDGGCVDIIDDEGDEISSLIGGSSHLDGHGWTVHDEEPDMKIEVGKKYELNNGDVHECVRMHGDDHIAVDKYGLGPFVIGNVLYHQDGRFADCDLDHDLRVKREVLTIETRDQELTSPYGDGNHPLHDVTPETGTLAELKVKHGS